MATDWYTSLLGDKLMNGAEEVDTKTALFGTDKEPKALKAVGFYFSAHWCPPCRRFTPELTKVYNELILEEYRNFEVIFVSSDNSDEAFLDYFGEMPWWALPYENRKAKQALSDHFQVSGIPTLVVLDRNYEVI